jgi:cytochrome P450
VKAIRSEEMVARRQEPGPREDILSLLLAARYEDGRAMTEQEVKVR